MKKRSKLNDSSTNFSIDMSNNEFIYSSVQKTQMQRNSRDRSGRNSVNGGFDDPFGSIMSARADSIESNYDINDHKGTRSSLAKLRESTNSNSMVRLPPMDHEKSRAKLRSILSALHDENSQSIQTLEVRSPLQGQNKKNFLEQLKAKRNNIYGEKEEKSRQSRTSINNSGSQERLRLQPLEKKKPRIQNIIVEVDAEQMQTPSMIKQESNFILRNPVQKLLSRATTNVNSYANLPQSQQNDETQQQQDNSSASPEKRRFTRKRSSLIMGRQNLVTTIDHNEWDQGQGEVVLLGSMGKAKADSQKLLELREAQLEHERAEQQRKEKERMEEERRQREEEERVEELKRVEAEEFQEKIRRTAEKRNREIKKLWLMKQWDRIVQQRLQKDFNDNVETHISSLKSHLSGCKQGMLKVWKAFQKYKARKEATVQLQTIKQNAMSAIKSEFHLLNNMKNIKNIYTHLNKQSILTFKQQIRPILMSQIVQDKLAFDLQVRRISLILVQAAFRMVVVRKAYLQKRRAVILIQSRVKGIRDRKKVVVLKEQAEREQRRKRIEEGKRRLEIQKRRREAVFKIEKFFSLWLLKKELNKIRKQMRTLPFECRASFVKCMELKLSTYNLKYQVNRIEDKLRKNGK